MTVLQEKMRPSSSAISLSVSSLLFQTACVFAASYLCLSCGTFLGYTSSAIESIRRDTSLNYTLTDHDVSWIGSLGPMGAIAGSLFATIPIKYFGVKGTLFYCGLTAFATSWLTISMSTSFTSILMGRFVGGIGTGFTIACTPIYVVGIVNKDLRGRLGVAPQFLMLFGILLSYTIGTFVNWSEHALICLFITLPAVVFLYFVPHTPAWLLQQGNHEQALSMLERLNGKVIGMEEYDRLRKIHSHSSSISSATTTASDTISTSTSAVQEEEETSNSPKVKFLSNIVRKISNIDSATIKPIAIGLCLMTFQQFIGINGITFYAMSIFQESSGVHNWGIENLPSILLATVQCLSALMSTLLIDRVGRRFLLILSSFITCIASIVLGCYFYIIRTDRTLIISHISSNISEFEDSTVAQAASDYEHLFWLPLTILIVYTFGFAIGFGPVPYLYLTEILPEHIRAIFNPIIISYTFLCVFAVTKSFPYLKAEINLFGVFWFYACCSAIAFVFIIFFIPETKGKSLEQVRQYFLSNNGKNLRPQDKEEEEEEEEECRKQENNNINVNCTEKV